MSKTTFLKDIQRLSPKEVSELKDYLVREEFTAKPEHRPQKPRTAEDALTSSATCWPHETFQNTLEGAVK